jgi:hypothetical protein
MCDVETSSQNVMYNGHIHKFHKSKVYNQIEM